MGSEHSNARVRAKGNGQPEKKLKPLFTSGGGQKHMQGKSLWNKDGMRYFKSVEVKWEEIYDSEDNKKILYNKWEEWITSKGKEMTVGDGTKKTFHYVMATWFDEETPESKKTNHDSEDEESFGVGGGYSSDRGRSRHSIAWQSCKLRDVNMKGGEMTEDSESEEDGNNNDCKRPPLFSIAVAGSSGVKSVLSAENPAATTRSVCVEALVPVGSVLLDMRLQPLTLSPREVLPHMWSPVVLSLRTSWEAFKRDFQQVPFSSNSMTCSDVIAWPFSPSSLHHRPIHLEQRDISLLLTHTGQF